MIVGSSQELSEDLVGIAPRFTLLSDKLQSYFLVKSYGLGIETLVVGIICVKPEFDFFFKVRKKYSKKRKLLEYDIKLDHAKVLAADQNELVEIIRDGILGSFAVFDELKIKDFDAERFKSDMVDFFAHLPQE